MQNEEQRDKFEEWAKKSGWTIIYEKNRPNQTYWMNGLEHCWRAWQAAMLLQKHNYTKKGRTFSKRFKTMTEPTEDDVMRVAKAICPWYEGKKSFSEPEEIWQWLHTSNKAAYIKQAKAAIAAMPLPEREYVEPNINICPGCGGEADNGHDRCVPPSPYYCTKCSATPHPGDGS